MSNQNVRCPNCGHVLAVVSETSGGYWHQDNLKEEVLSGTCDYCGVSLDEEVDGCDD
jgi:hypothetical protein